MVFVCNTGIRWGFLKPCHRQCGARTAQHTTAKNILASKWHTHSVHVDCLFFFSCCCLNIICWKQVFPFLGQFSTPLAVFFFFVITFKWRHLSSIVWGHKIQLTRTSQVHAGPPRSQEVWASLAAATWARGSPTVTMMDANYYPAVDSPQQHTLWSHTAHLHPAASQECSKSSRVKPVPQTSACLCASK